jgi:tetratricopeptide (TPR) repeat protein
VTRRTTDSRSSLAHRRRLRSLAASSAPAFLAAVISLALPPAVLAKRTAATFTDAEAITSALNQKYDAGVSRAMAAAQACYREALAMDAERNAAEAVRLLDASAEFDPDFPDAHFTLARVLTFRDPGRAVGELSEAFRVLGRSYPWQRHLLANALTGLIAVWMVSLLFAVIGIAFRHFPHLVHIVRELLRAPQSHTAQASATVVTVSPAMWGLGAIPTAALFAGLTSFRLGRREVILVLLFLGSALVLAGGTGAIAPWAGAPTLEEPGLLVDRAMGSGYDADVAAALIAWEGHDATEALFPFALGSMARRTGGLDLAERQLTLAAVLRPKTWWILTNLGNVYFAREEFARARQTYEAAAAAAPGAVEPHFNLAQVYTKQLMFTEASLEQSRASSISFDRVADFSRWTAPQLNRSVMDARPPTQALWRLSRRLASHTAPNVREGNALIRWVTRLAPPAPFALVFIPAIFLISAGIGQFMGRGLPTTHCSNCQTVICRRCVKRMQQRAFCENCFRSVKDLKSTEFTKLLLTRQGRGAARRRTVGQAIITVLLPGAAPMLRGATLSGFLALLLMSAAAVLVISNGALVPSLDVLPFPSAGWGKRIPLVLLFLATYVISVTRYFSTTTAHVEDLTAPADEAAKGSARTPRARTGRRP